MSDSLCEHGIPIGIGCVACMLLAKTIEVDIFRQKLEESAKQRQRLTEALQHYESPDNWECDDVGIARVWRQPNANMPKAYAGFELAMKALDGLKKEKFGL